MLVGGTIFVVEVKNYKGRLVWEDAGERRLMPWKIGHYGETILPKPAKNPLAQARSYIRPAKAYLSATCDARFSNVYMERSESLHELRILRQFTAWTKG